MLVSNVRTATLIKPIVLLTGFADLKLGRKMRLVKKKYERKKHEPIKEAKIGSYG